MDLSTYLKTNGISRRDFAERVGVSTEAVRLWEERLRVPRKNVMPRIVAETDGIVSPASFFDAQISTHENGGK